MLGNTTCFDRTHSVWFPTCDPRNMSDPWASFIGSINSSGQRHCVTGYFFTGVLSQLSGLIYKGRKAEYPFNKTTTLFRNVGKKVPSDEGSHAGSTDTCGISEAVEIWECRHIFIVCLHIFIVCLHIFIYVYIYLLYVYIYLFMSTYIYRMSTHIYCMSTYIYRMSTYIYCMSIYIYCMSTYIYCMSTYIYCMSTYIYCMQCLIVLSCLCSCVVVSYNFYL
jgi:hypothetical protein